MVILWYLEELNLLPQCNVDGALEPYTKLSKMWHT
jgi:hypothetical protein